MVHTSHVNNTNVHNVRLTLAAKVADVHMSASTTEMHALEPLVDARVPP